MSVQVVNKNVKSQIPEAINVIIITTQSHTIPYHPIPSHTIPYHPIPSHTIQPRPQGKVATQLSLPCLLRLRSFLTNLLQTPLLHEALLHNLLVQVG